MLKAELLALLTPEALQLLNETAPPASSAETLKLVSSLRKAGISAETVAAVVSQLQLRQKAQSKFQQFSDSMLYNQAGLEQATRLAVAAQHAGRYYRAGIKSVADLGCGLGAESLALAALGLKVFSVEKDEVTSALASYNLASFPKVTVLNQAAEEFDLSQVEALFFDPSRRSSNHNQAKRLAEPADWSPNLEFCFELAQKFPTGIKLSPGFPSELIPENCETQWLSHHGELVETSLWFGQLAREGIRRSALVMSKDRGTAELNSANWFEPHPEAQALKAYIYEADPAIIRSQLVGELAKKLGAAPISPGISYLSSDDYTETAFATGFKVLEVLPAGVDKLRKELKARGIGTLEIKKRGIDIVPEEFRKRLKLDGKNSATVILTRIQNEHQAILVERIV